jgi:replicative DNA helicase
MAAVDELETHRARRPRVTQLIYDDVTIEAAKTALAEQNGAIAVMSAESAFLSIAAGKRYSESPNLDVILNGHAGDSIRVNRSGRPSESVDRACLTLCLMVQPAVIRELGTSPGFVMRGAAARLLPSFPPDLLGRRRIDVTPVPLALGTAWSDTIARTLQRAPVVHEGAPVPWMLGLAPDAREHFRAYREWHEPQLAPDGAFGDMRDWAGKQCGAVLRLAGLLHIAQHVEPERVPISAETLERATVIVDYFEAHARLMYRLLRGRSDHSNARAMLDALRSLGSPTTRRVMHRKLQGRAAFEKSKDLDAPLNLLEEYGYVRRPGRTPGVPGRPAEVIELNPLMDCDKTDRNP